MFKMSNLGSKVMFYFGQRTSLKTIAESFITLLYNKIKIIN